MRVYHHYCWFLYAAQRQVHMNLIFTAISTLHDNLLCCISLCWRSITCNSEDNIVQRNPGITQHIWVECCWRATMSATLSKMIHRGYHHPDVTAMNLFIAWTQTYIWFFNKLRTIKLIQIWASLQNYLSTFKLAC